MNRSLLTSEQIATIVKTHINDYGQLCDSDDFEIFAKNISNLVTAKAQERIENLNAALVQIANHVGACCGGVDAPAKIGNGSDTAQAIIRRIDEIFSDGRKEALEDAAIAAWSSGMKQHNEHKGLPYDCREVGSICAREIRALAKDDSNDGVTPYCTLKARINSGIRTWAYRHPNSSCDIVSESWHKSKNATLILDENVKL